MLFGGQNRSLAIEIVRGSVVQTDGRIVQFNFYESRNDKKKKKTQEKKRKEKRELDTINRKLDKKIIEITVVLYCL